MLGRGLKSINLGTISWLLGEQHRKLGASALLPKAVSQVLGVKSKALVERDELFTLLQEAERQHETLADAAMTLFLRWHRRDLSSAPRPSPGVGVEVLGNPYLFPGKIRVFWGCL